jgi:hypothetical protein
LIDAGVRDALDDLGYIFTVITCLVAAWVLPMRTQRMCWYTTDRNFRDMGT